MMLDTIDKVIDFYRSNESIDLWDVQYSVDSETLETAAKLGLIKKAQNFYFITDLGIKVRNSGLSFLDYYDSEKSKPVDYLTALKTNPNAIGYYQETQPIHVNYPQPKAVANKKLVEKIIEDMRKADNEEAVKVIHGNSIIDDAPDFVKIYEDSKNGKIDGQMLNTFDNSIKMPYSFHNDGKKTFKESITNFFKHKATVYFLDKILVPLLITLVAAFVVFMLKWA